VSNQQLKIPEVRFNLKEPNQKNATLIYAAFRYDGKKLVYSTKHKIAPGKWEKRKQLPKSGYKYYNDLKEDLDEIRDKIIEVYVDNPKMDLRSFKEKLDIALERTNSEEKEATTIIGFIDDYIERRRTLRDVRENTIKKYLTIKNRLIDYSIFIGRDLSFDDIDLEFRDKFLEWLYEHTNTKSQNTANKYFVNLKLLLKKSYKLGLHSNEIFNDEDFNVKRVETSIFSLNEEEVDALQKLESFNKEKLRKHNITESFAHKARDWFLVACYSSLRWSDFTVLSKENIRLIDDHHYIFMKTLKTSKDVWIPIDDRLLPILKKYDYTSPTMSSQRFNEAIKVISEMAGLTDKIIMSYSERGQIVKRKVRKCDVISSKIGRRTWATINYSKGYPILLLMQCTGHSKESTFMSYIGISKKDQAIELMRRMKQGSSEN
jgi:integrase